MSGWNVESRVFSAECRVQSAENVQTFSVCVEITVSVFSTNFLIGNLYLIESGKIF